VTIALRTKPQRKTLIVVGNGMVGHRFCERLVEYDKEGAYEIVVFGDEPRPAYDRVHLTSYLGGKTVEELTLADSAWYRDNGIALRTSTRIASIDPRARAVVTADGERLEYAKLVLATGSSAFVPPMEGVQKQGVFVYRTIEDLDAIAAYAGRARRAAVLGGGLLGLEAAKAVHDLGLETHVVEFAPRLMPRQLDGRGANLLKNRVEALGVRVLPGKNATRVLGGDAIEALEFADGETLEVDMLVVSAGIVPRDELARAAGLSIGPRGGIEVDDAMHTSDPDIYAIGEVALHAGSVYGLVGPGYAMADVVAKNLTGQSERFAGADLSTKLKLLGVEVASFGEAFADTVTGRSIVLEDLVQGVYKKLVLSEDGKRLIGGMLVGDAARYMEYLSFARGDAPLPDSSEELLIGVKPGAGSAPLALSDAAQVCSCNNVTKRDLLCAIRERNLTDAGALKSCTKAGTGCGGCMPLVTDLLNAELAAMGKAVRPRLCEHFDYSRQELFEIVKVCGFERFEDVIKNHGSGLGCEICKPAVASIFASLWNAPILEQDTLQDTNDRFLANMQRGGLYSVVPRVAGGEITPEKLIVLGQVAKKYGLYTKITGGQRIDLFGARLEQLPDIWEELVHAGFESGHAYGKALRTVKSCVGTTWCRFGVQDAVGFAIRLENRYKGIRAPHKLKSAVSGCIRECAEAQSKDFAVIATEKGWNLYVCGNGGAKPRHADLLASDLDDDTVIRYVDRFLMYYIGTADRLTRTAVWLDKMEGGIEYLREVILHDRLQICDQLERQMQHLVSTYHCEWAEVVNNPERRARFRHFVDDAAAADPSIEFVTERGQRRPRDWVKNGSAVNGTNGHANGDEKAADSTRIVRLPIVKTEWVRVASVSEIPADGGATIRYGKAQIAVFNFASKGEWYACQNMCPHKKDMVLARGIVGDQNGTPKVACPLHKKTFSLEDGACLTGENYRVTTFPVKVLGDGVYLELPSVDVVERLLEPSEPRWQEARASNAALRSA